MMRDRVSTFAKWYVGSVVDRYSENAIEGTIVVLLIVLLATAFWK